MNIAIIGCGLIGQKRAAAIGKAEGDQVVVVCDKDPAIGQKLAGSIKADFTDDWRVAIRRPDVEAVVIAAFHGVLAEATAAALAAGKHVLVEKPAAKHVHELEPVVAQYERVRTKLKAKVGFNHRFHPAMWQAKTIIDAGTLGDLMFIRGRYGHGGRVGYDKEWRSIPELSGGGELLDQGMHLIDLSRWYLGDFAKVQGTTKTYFWDMKVDDNAFMTLETPAGQVAQLHVTWTEWKNLFSLEIYGRHGKLHIEGLGGSYGVERLAHYQMRPAMGPPDTLIYEYPGADLSWDAEWRNFRDAILGRTSLVGDLIDAYKAHQIIHQIYRENGHDYR